MNIFYLDACPFAAAKMMVDKHVVKMILETAQLLSTAHRVLDGEMKIIPEKNKSGKIINRKRWVLPDDRNDILYSATHINHPSDVWARRSNNNYIWLHCHFLALLQEYEYRYEKIHKSKTLLEPLRWLPDNIPVGPKTLMPLAMPDEYKTSDPVSSYRNYYKYGKNHLHAWKKREKPTWMENNIADEFCKENLQL